MLAAQPLKRRKVTPLGGDDGDLVQGTISRRREQNMRDSSPGFSLNGSLDEARE